MDINIPQQVKHIISTLETNNYEAYIVGGCVRDIIRGVAPKDWDIATSATPPAVKALFVRTVDTGIKHGTITVLLNRQHYEVTTYRTDGEYLDSRRPETVEFVSNIKEDLSRRDFTMNAIAYHPNKGFVDPFGGVEDINKQIIRCVGNPLHRFEEDALRMLRAIRFSGVTGFAICHNLIEAICELKHNLANISPERVREELVKLIASPHPEAVDFLHTTGLLPFVLQGQNYNGDIVKVIKWLKKCQPQETMRMALFLYWAGDNCENILRDLRFDNKSIKEISLYVRMLNETIPHDRYEIKKQLRYIYSTLGILSIPTGPTPTDCKSRPVGLVGIDDQFFNNLLDLRTIHKRGNIDGIRQEAADIIQKRECFTLKDLAINGKDLAELGIPKGKGMGDVLEYLLDMVMQNPGLNTKEALKASIKISSTP